MKTAYIIFRDVRPHDSEEVLNLIIHFCREHELSYHLYSESGSSLINIEGNDYFIKLQEQKEVSSSSYWMICCLLKGQSTLCKNIA